MQFNTRSFLIPNNNLTNTNIPFLDSIRLSNFNNIVKDGITIQCPIILDSNTYNIAYIDTGAFNNLDSIIIHKLNESGLLCDKIFIYKYDRSLYNLVDYIDNLYDKYNIRLFLSSANSQDCESLFNYLYNHNDILFISSSSTVNFLNKPNNLLRLSLQDDILLNNIFQNIIPYFYKLTNISSNNNNSINNIYLIYTNDVFSNNFKSTLQNIQSSFNNFNFFFLEFDKDPQTNIFIKNTIINSNHISDLFIIATLLTQNLLNFFDNQLMYNKLIFFTDPFNNIFLFSQFNFTNSYIIIGSDNNDGHILTSKFLNLGKGASSSNKQINSLINFLNINLNLIYKNIGNNLNNIISLLNSYGLFNNGQWYSQYVGIYKLNQTFNDNKYFFTYNFSLFNNKYNPTATGFVTDDESYPYTFISNINTLQTNNTIYSNNIFTYNISGGFNT